MSDAGTPFVLSLPSSVPIVELYDEIAQRVDQEIQTIKPNKKEVSYDPTTSRVVITSDG